MKNCIKFLRMAKISIYKIYLVELLLLVSFMFNDANSQIYPASPANWLYPKGNSEGTRRVIFPSQAQRLDSIVVKWSTDAIAGDIEPLIGNIINNVKLFDSFPYAPNEIAAVIGNDIIVVDGTGRTYIRRKSDDIKLIKGISVLLDTLSTGINNLTQNPVVMGLETIESQSEDTLAFAYLAGFDGTLNNSKILKRLAIDMRLYKPNIYAGVKPIFSKKNGDDLVIYATMNISKPNATDGAPIIAPFLRGFTQFHSNTKLPNYPSYDVADDIAYRLTFGPEIGFSQPSISDLGINKNGIIFPNYPNPSMNVKIKNTVTFETATNEPYLLGFNLSSNPIDQLFDPNAMTQRVNGSRPQLRNYFVKLNNGDLPESSYILVAEEYKGIEGSIGTARLHLYDYQGDPITLPNDLTDPPIVGGSNHLWSVATGNVDGNATNDWKPYYPNNIGNELVITQSSREFAFPSSKLMILKYNTKTIDKPSPPNTVLYPFDTLCTQRINGWVAAVNDLDKNPDGKDEILLVDGSKIMILRLRDYNNIEFKFGRPFDTVYVKEFDKETISTASIADMDGDGKNDIIVTTYKKTYVIGMPLQNTLQVLAPRAPATKTQYCLGDSINIQWRNVLAQSGTVDIYFQRFKKLNDTSNTLILVDTIPKIIRKNIANNVDIASYKLNVDTTYLGKIGLFIVASSSNPKVVYDTTSILKFQTLEVILDSLPSKVLMTGENFNLTGNVACIDSLSFDYWESSGTWTLLKTVIYDNSGKFKLNAQVPCLNIFNCDGKDADSLLRIRVVNHKAGLSLTSLLFNLPIKPSLFPFKIDTLATASPNKVMKWKQSDIKYSCDSVSLYFSIDGGQKFGFIQKLKAQDEYFQWNIPLGLPDSVVLRICCENSCLRTDTLINDMVPKYIQIVSPNPFSPIDEALEIIYKVPEDVKVDIRIYDESNRIVAEPVINQQRAAKTVYTDRWDGRIANGVIAANGLYYLRIEMSNGTREIYTIFVRK
ncbi:MAG: hypothetical protein NTW25_16680 [Candidatus Kapabacteria bacterium]|nr:hypothetical protein [Candidatus Kapabacteria bacterium]